jgi:hypothetical protein
MLDLGPELDGGTPPISSGPRSLPSMVPEDEEREDTLGNALRPLRDAERGLTPSMGLPRVPRASLPPEEPAPVTMGPPAAPS